MKPLLLSCPIVWAYVRVSGDEQADWRPRSRSVAGHGGATGGPAVPDADERHPGAGGEGEGPGEQGKLPQQ